MNNLNFDLQLQLSEYLLNYKPIEWLQLVNLDKKFYTAALYTLRKNRVINDINLSEIQYATMYIQKFIEYNDFTYAKILFDIIYDYNVDNDTTKKYKLTINMDDNVINFIDSMIDYDDNDDVDKFEFMLDIINSENHRIDPNIYFNLIYKAEHNNKPKIAQLLHRGGMIYMDSYIDMIDFYERFNEYVNLLRFNLQKSSSTMPPPLPGWY